jgi:beta-lactam-binding protein with PASTA domain/predicted Ser/Thr protein kinase
MPDPALNTLVDGRYRVLSRLGAGGMADVYLAEDQQLGRKVALKLLHRRFAEDPGFVERFRREAQAAAGLQHPNVVSVYDRGKFDDTPYIAMEYLPGRSLKQVIREEAPLDPVRAIDIAIQILRAARFAHNHGIVHRDLKPHNVIVDDAGHAKVTDFGIARAGASDMTETGSIMGTAQYLSPEQAQGQPVGPGSDLYSVGVVIYEMLTGRVPFDAESPVTIALKHVSEAPVPPRSINPDITPELEQTVLWVLNKDPRDRPADADQLITVLEHCREAITSAGSGQHTASMAAVAAAGAAAGAGAAIAAPLTRRDPAHNGSGEYVAVPVADERRRRDWAPWAWATLVVLLIAAAAVAAYLLTRPQDYVVPSVTGEQINVARTVVQADKFSVAVIDVPNAAPKGTVIGEDPGAGTRAASGSTVTLTVSAGPSNVAVPSVQGDTVAAATRALRSRGLKVGRVERQSSNTFPIGQVMSTDPAVAQSVAPGTPVTLLVSLGQPRKKVPNVVGESKANAVTDLKASGFAVITNTQSSTTIAPGNVISQSPAAGTSQTAGSSVTITVATAPPTVAVPSVTGDQASQAASAITAAGLNVSEKSKQVKQQSRDGIVITQTPAASSSVRKGSTVTITVGHYAAPASSSTSSASTSSSSSTTSTTTSTTGALP